MQLRGEAATPPLLHAQEVRKQSVAQRLGGPVPGRLAHHVAGMLCICDFATVGLLVCVSALLSVLGVRARPRALGC